MSKIRKSTSLKIAAVALGVAGIVGLTISSAASLGVGAGSLGAGTSVVAACQPAAAPISVGFTTTYSATAPAGYTVTAIKLSAIDAACNGKSISVTLQGAANASIVEVTGIAAAGTVTLTVPGAVSANAVVGTAVVVYN